MDQLLTEISKCTICKDFLPNDPKPIVQASPNSKIVIIGQAPGQRVQTTGIPWDDPSGVNLKAWLGVDNSTFYDPEEIALIPMGFCYPGTGRSGDLPPRPECAPLWHERLLSSMPQVELVLLIGLYAQKYYLGDRAKRTLTETVRNYHEYLPIYLPLPHPSPRNNIWQKKNPWFKTDLIQVLQRHVEVILKQ